MSNGVRPRPLAAIAGMLAAWVAAQFWLAHRAIMSVNAQFDAAYQRMSALTSSRGLPAPRRPTHLPDAIWIRAGVESAVAVLLLSVIAAALVVAGVGGPHS
jgi:hypothetical protein